MGKKKTTLNVNITKYDLDRIWAKVNRMEECSTTALQDDAILTFSMPQEEK